MAGVMSTITPSRAMRWGLSRLVPRMVPPTVRMPARTGESRRILRSSARPRNPSRNPTSCMPWRPRAALPRARMAAFRPGLSPPAVRIPMRRAVATVTSIARGPLAGGPDPPLGQLGLDGVVDGALGEVVRVVVGERVGRILDHAIHDPRLRAEDGAHRERH